MLNGKGEVADILDVSQFIGGRSAYECVAYAAALIKFCGQPGQGPAGSALQASNLAQYWYGREEGSNSANNTNGMGIKELYDMLRGMSLLFESLPASVEGVKGSLRAGYPVILCGAETGMYDIGLGDIVPYDWTPSGNHAIVASGIAPDGNLLVHDCASIGPNGVRPGPRKYDVNKLKIVSATAVHVAWGAQIVPISISSVGNYFKELDAHRWQVIASGSSHGLIIQFGILDIYKSLGVEGSNDLRGLSWLGLPLTNEIIIDANGSVKQFFERGCLVYNPKKNLDNPPASGPVFAAHVYGDNVLGQDPHIPDLLAQITSLQKLVDTLKNTQSGNPQDTATLQKAAPLIAQLAQLIPAATT